jgi:hypothetical protein
MSEVLKSCNKCKEIKKLSEFNKDKNHKDGHKNTCRKCANEMTRLWKANNKDHVKKYRDEHKDDAKKWREANKEKQDIYFKNRYQEKKKIINAKNLERIRNNEELRLLRNLRCRISKAITYNIKSKSTKELLGCSADYLKTYLEEQFVDGMNWDNYGEWHVDHIYTLCIF